MASVRQKIGIIGAGAVGFRKSAVHVLRGVAREIVVVNRDPKRARGVVADVQYGATLSSAVDIRAGDYPDLNGATLVMIAAGTNEKARRCNGSQRFNREAPAARGKRRRLPADSAQACVNRS